LMHFEKHSSCHLSKSLIHAHSSQKLQCGKVAKIEGHDIPTTKWYVMLVWQSMAMV
jgi:hypothetical protein